MMKKGFGKRLISMMVAICMILTICPVNVLAGNEGDPKTTVASKLVAGAYGDLSQAEKDLIGSGLLADVTYEYYVPAEGDNLIEVDTESKTVTAKSWTDDKGNVWNPVGADIVAGGSSVESVTPDGADTYEYDGNAFSVKVTYEMYVSVAAAVQEQLLNTSGWLKDGIANLDTIAAQSGNMGVVELAMPQLVELRDKVFTVPGTTMTAALGDEGKAAITAMNDQMTANGGKLTLNAMVGKYKSGSGTEYLLNSGSEMKVELTALTGYVTTLATALGTLKTNSSMLVSWGAMDTATSEALVLLADKVNALKAGLESAGNGDWTAAEKGTALVKDGISPEEYATLDTLVAALSEIEVKTFEDISVKDSFLAAETVIQFNLSMKNVTVLVKLEVVDNAVGSAELVAGGKDGSVVLTLAEYATKAEIQAALDAAIATVEADAIAAWGDAYVDGHYVRSVTKLPETLTEDIEYVITWSPALYTITYDYDEGLRTVEVPYGYKTLLETYTGADEQVYDYTVNGSYLPQGSVYTVLGDVTVTRQTGKAYDTTDLYTAISKMAELSGDEKAKERAILTAGALLGNTLKINVRYPDTLKGSLVSVDSNLVLTGETYASDYEGLVWVPYSYIVEAGDGTPSAPAGFTKDGDVYTAQITDGNFKNIQVYYRLSLTNFDEDAAQTALELVEQLVAEAKSQKTALASLSSPAVSGNLDLLNKTILGVMKDEVNGNVLHDDADKDVLLKECFNTVIEKIIATCLNGDGDARIGLLIADYNDAVNKLEYYYLNSEDFIKEVELLSGHLNEMLGTDENLTADDKLEALRRIIDALPSSIVSDEKVDEYAAKLPTLQEKMNGIEANLLPVNDAIDTGSSKLLKLVTALEMDGTVGTDCSGYVYLESENFDVAGSGQINLRVQVVYGGNSTILSETVEQNAPISQIAIDSLKSKVAALLQEMGVVEDAWYRYECEAYDDGAALNKLVGQSYANDQIFNFTWVRVEKTPCERGEHKEEILSAKTPTCTEPGLTQGKKCSVCGEILVAQEEIPATGHTEQTIPAVDPTCTEPGSTQGTKCSVCLVVLVEPEKVKELGHDMGTSWLNDESGHWKACKRSDCGYIEEWANHSYPTNDCTVEAYCSICNFHKQAGVHTFDSEKYPMEPVDDTWHQQTCTSCKLPQKSEHKWTRDEGSKKAATCEENGYEKYTCVCGAEKIEEPEMLGHSWGDWYMLNDEQHRRVCSNDTTENCVQTEDHTWDIGVENADGERIDTCNATGCGATRLVVLNREEKLVSGIAIKVQLKIEDGFVELPEPQDSEFFGTGYRYDYTVNGNTYKVYNDDGKPVTVPASSVDGATVKLVNIDNEKLETLKAEMGGGVEFVMDPNKQLTEDGYYTGIEVKTDVNGMVNVIKALVLQEKLDANNKYGYVALGDEPLLKDGKMSLLGLLRMMMTDGTYTSQDLIDLSNGTNKTLISSQLVLKSKAPNTYALRRSTAVNDGHALNFKLVLTATPAELGKLGEALVNVQDYITFDIKAAYDENDELISNRLDIDIKAKLPKKVYEIYVAALRLTGALDVNDANAVKEKVAYEFLKDYVEVLMGTEVTTTTLMNTAAKLGKTVDLADFESIFNAMKGKLDYGRAFTYSDDGLSAVATFTHDEMEKAVDQLEPMVGDADLLDLLKGMLVECEAGKTVDIHLNAFVTNFTDGTDTDDFIDTNYQAIVIDMEEAKKPGKEKAGAFDITENLAASVAGLKGNAAIMLQKDVVADLHFKNTNTILDLNGHTIDGTITADDRLIIVDSTLANATAGRVTKTITGSNITILAGTYGTDITSYLKKGYVQQANGTVKNEYYEITKDGNDITFEINADILDAEEKPAAKWLAADMAGDLAMTYLTSSSLAFADLNDTTCQNPYSIFSANVDNLLTLISESTGEDQIKAILDFLNLHGADGVEGFINDLLVKSMDFGTLATAVKNKTALIKYNVVTKPWVLKLSPVTGEDYLTVGIKSGEKVYGSVAVTLVGEQENRDKVETMLSELDKIMDSANSVTVTLQDPTFTGGTLSVIGTGDATINADMTGNPDYAAITAVILAKRGVYEQEFVDALTAYFADKTDTEALYRTLAKVTLAQSIDAVKNLSMDKDFATMLTDLGVTNGAGSSAVELGDAFHMVIASVGRLLANQKINGDNRILFGASGENSYTGNDIVYDISRVVFGYTVSGKVTAENISSTVKLFPAVCEHSYAAVVTPPTCGDQGYTTHTCSKCGDSYVDTYVNPTGNHTDNDKDNKCDDCDATICEHTYVPVVTKPTCEKGGYTTHTCSKCGHSYEDNKTNPTGIHKDANGDKKCDECSKDMDNGSGGGNVGGGGGGVVSKAIEVLKADKTQALKTDSFAAAIEAAQEGYTIKINSAVSMTGHAYVNAAITITGAGKLTNTGYVIYLNNTAAKITADANLSIGSNVEAYKAACAGAGPFTYTLEKINVPKTDAPVAGSKVETINNKLYLLLDLSNDGMTLNALRENTAFSDLAGTIKFEIEGNDGTGLIKTTDRMTVSSYNADNNRMATITYVVIVMGDTNCNGKVNTSDATIMKNINFGETYDLEVLIAADVNFSGTYQQPKVNSSDATYIMSKWFNWSTGKYTTNLE